MLTEDGRVTERRSSSRYSLVKRFQLHSNFPHSVTESLWSFCLYISRYTYGTHNSSSLQTSTLYGKFKRNFLTYVETSALLKSSLMFSREFSPWEYLYYNLPFTSVAITSEIKFASPGSQSFPIQSSPLNRLP